MGEVLRRLNADEKTIEQSPVDAATLAALIGRIVDGTVSNSGAKQVFDVLWAAGEIKSDPIGADSVDRAVVDLPGSRVDRVIESKGLKQMSDTSELDRLLDELLAANTKSVEEYRAGKEKAFNALVGQAMKATKGKANPAQVTALLKQKLG